MPASPEEIGQLQARLRAHRATLDHYLTRQALLGSAHAPPEVSYGIRESRDGIRQIKATLRGWGVSVDDLPGDEDVAGGVAAPPPVTAAPPGQGRRTSPFRRLVEIVGFLATVTACVAAVVVVPEVRSVLFPNQTVGEPVGVAATSPGLGEPAVITPPPTTEAASPSQPTEPSRTDVPAQATVASPADMVDVSGRWVGIVSQPLGDGIYNFTFSVELTQSSEYLIGESRIEEVGDPKSFNTFRVSGQVVQEEGALLVSFDETDYIEANNTGSVFDATSLKDLRLTYIAAEGKEYLEGVWFDSTTSSREPDGTVKLVRVAADTGDAALRMPAGLLDTTGRWEGIISERLGDSVYNFTFSLELAQSSEYLTGASRVEEVGDSKSFNTFRVSGQVVQEAGGFLIILVETDYIEAGGLSSVSDATSLKHMRLTYVASAGEERLEGEWSDDTTNSWEPSGTIKLTRRP